MLHRCWEDGEDIETQGALAADVLESLQQMQLSPGWLELVDCIESEIDAKLTALELSDREAERNRGYIAALRDILALPETICADAGEVLNQARGE